MANFKLRLIVGGTVIEGAQVALSDLPDVDRGGAAELVGFLGGGKRVLILQRPVIHGSVGETRSQPRYLVIRQDQIQACEFVLPEAAEGNSSHDSFRWEWAD